MTTRHKIRQLLFPPLTPRSLIRLLLVGLFAYLFFGYVCIPIRIQGYSMEPTYLNGRINFCWTLSYLFSEPARQDVVLVRFAGKKVMLLKRIVGLEGDTVEFRDGRLFVNAAEVEEPYVYYPCNWRLSPRRVRKGFLYVVGDNRGMPMKSHSFGQVSAERILGMPLW